MLDLVFLASDSGGFAPVYLSDMNRAIGKPNVSDAPTLAPSTTAINPPEALDLADRGAGGESFDPGYFTENLESHPLIAPIAARTVNVTKPELRIAKAEHGLALEAA